MDIFFCDLCGARVSDADLRAGHGTRRRWDVICGACLEQGHGQEWLSQRAGMKPAVAAAVAAAAPGGPPPSASAAVLDAPRDRARTIEEDEEPQRPIAARPVPRDDTADAPMPFAREDHEITTRVPVPGQAEPQLSAAAGAFARLAEEAKPEPVMRDDLDDVREDLPGGGMTPTPAPAVSPFAFESRKETDEDAKTGTASTAKPGVGRKPSPSSSRSGQAKSGSGKSTSGRVAKSSRRTASSDGSRKILMVTGATSLLLILAIVGVLLKGHSVKPGKVTTEFPTKDLEAKVSSTRDLAVGALRSHEAAKLQQARDAIDSSMNDVLSFQDKVEKRGWTEEQVGDFLQRLRYPELKSLKRSINDELMKQKDH